MVITVALIWFYRVQLDFNLVYPRFGTCRKASSRLFMQSNISNANTDNYLIWFASQPSALGTDSSSSFHIFVENTGLNSNLFTKTTLRCKQDQLFRHFSCSSVVRMLYHEV